MKRAVCKIFVHSSATPQGRHHTAADICRWHREAGKREIGYHYVIQLDGTIENGRDSNAVGAHVLGHNTGSIGICYIGGVDASMLPKDTRTVPQKNALIKLISELKKEFPNATVHGHREFGKTACPSFDVQTEYKCL